MSDRTNDEEIAQWHRRFAADCNNRAWSLSEAAARSPSEDDEMLDAAHASALHWRTIGTEPNVARAEMLLGHVHALLGHGELAMRYAGTSLAYFAAHDCAEWERAFAHAVLANAAAAAGNVDLHLRHYASAKEIGEALSNAEERRIFEATFRRIPAARSAR